MSGPIAAEYGVDPISVLLTAAMLRLREGQQQAADLQAAYAAQQSSLQYARFQAHQQQQAALQQQRQQAETDLAAVLQLAASYSENLTITPPCPPSELDNETQLLAYIQSLQQVTQHIRQILLTHCELNSEQRPTANLQALIAQLQSTPAPEHSNPISKLLRRIEHLGEIPVAIQQISQQIAAEPHLETQRAKLLQTELRLQIQQHLVASQAQALEAASALVLQHTLRELGYQVEDISDTLFVEGGVLHFRRQSWGNYMVRMRINPLNHSAHFNVIRAISESQNERSILDHLAEDRWCAEFPSLLQALEKNGLRLNVTRRLQAGEVPVQLVEQHKLPQFADEELAQQQQTLHAKEIR